MLKCSSMSESITPSSRDYKKATLPCCKLYPVGMPSAVQVVHGHAQ